MDIVASLYGRKTSEIVSITVVAVRKRKCLKEEDSAQVISCEWKIVCFDRGE